MPSQSAKRTVPSSLSCPGCWAAEAKMLHMHIPIDYPLRLRHNWCGGIALQLNIYVPKDKESLLAKLDAMSKELGKPKNEMVIEALERYLRLSAGAGELGKYPTKVTGPLSRRDIYGDRAKP